MVLFIENKKVVGIHYDDKIKELPQYINDTTCIVVEDTIKFPTSGAEEIDYYWNKEKHTMEMRIPGNALRILSLEEKIDKLIAHLGL